MLDRLYKETQDILNKNQLGYIKPTAFNRYAYNSLIKVYNKLRSDLKTHIRKKNWLLHSKNYAQYSDYTKQLIEYYAEVKELDNPYDLTGIEFILSTTNEEGQVVDKVDYQTLMDLKNSIYVKPTDCTAKLSKIGNKLVVVPEIKINVHYLRMPKVPKWTYNEVNGKPMFDPTKPDYQNMDAPESLYDELLSNIVEIASKEIRELNIAQLEQQEQAQDQQIDNAQ